MGGPSIFIAGGGISSSGIAAAPAPGVDAIPDITLTIGGGFADAGSAKPELSSIDPQRDVRDLTRESKTVFFFHLTGSGKVWSKFGRVECGNDLA